MSYWTHIIGAVIVEPLGETQPQRRYIVDTVLAHLPLVTGSERNMYTHVIQRGGYREWHSHDEFDVYSQQAQKKSGIELQPEYIIIVEGDFRDRKHNQTVREFTNWLCRLAKRIEIKDVFVKISSSDKRDPCIIINANEVFTDMFEKPSWCRRDKTKPPVSYNWCEYLIFDRESHNSNYPFWLADKYGFENDTGTIEKEAERRRWFRGW